MKYLWVAATLAVAACGGGGGGGDDSGPPDSQAQDDAFVPPDAHAGACTTGLPIFLNRGGGAYTMGATEDSTTNVSTIISANATLAANTEISDDDWNAMVACIADKFAPFAAVITDVDPGTDPHIEALFPIHSEYAGLGFGTGVVGVSPFSCAVIPNPIVITDLSAFTTTDVKDNCEVTAQLIGNSLGLDHEFFAQDIESYLNYTDPRSFVNMDEPCGENVARNCCDGSATQNTFAKLTDALGACQ